MTQVQISLPARTARILVVDDEATLREMVGLNLSAEGHDVVYAADGEAALRAARAERPDLVVLDVMLPDRDGFDVCRTLRRESEVPILLLSARGEAIDRITGLELGADDYLTKPFAMRELVARVRVMLRRQRLDTPVSESSPALTHDSDITSGDVLVSATRHQAWLGGALLTLTSKEFGLLQYFSRHPGILLSRDALLREVWGYEYPIDTRTVDVHIRSLRQKIEDDPARPKRIVTVRGHGYRFVPTAPTAPTAPA